MLSHVSYFLVNINTERKMKFSCTFQIYIMFLHDMTTETGCTFVLMITYRANVNWAFTFALYVIMSTKVQFSLACVSGSFSSSVYSHQGQYHLPKIKGSASFLPLIFNPKHKKYVHKHLNINLN